MRSVNTIPSETWDTMREISSQDNGIKACVINMLRDKTRGGWGGIRTHEGLAPLPVFKTGAFDRSATHPQRDITSPPPGVQGGNAPAAFLAYDRPFYAIGRPMPPRYRGGSRLIWGTGGARAWRNW